MISEKKLMELQKRIKIYDFIIKNPGLNKREISRRLSIPVTTLTYHLKFFKKIGLINEKIDGGYLRIFASNKIGTNDEQLLCLFRNKNSCKIFIYLLFSLSFSQIELSKELELSSPTVSHYLKKMVKMGIIEEVPVKNGLIYPFPNPKMDYVIQRKRVKSEKFYRRKNQEILNEASRVLIAHKHSLSDENLINSYLDYLECWGNIIPVKKLKSIDYRINTVIESISDIFRPPFCY